jgi:hypothetical protein
MRLFLGSRSLSQFSTRNPTMMTSDESQLEGKPNELQTLILQLRNIQGGGISNCFFMSLSLMSTIADLKKAVLQSGESSILRRISADDLVVHRVWGNPLEDNIQIEQACSGRIGQACQLFIQVIRPKVKNNLTRKTSISTNIRKNTIQDEHEPRPIYVQFKGGQGPSIFILHLTPISTVADLKHNAIRFGSGSMKSASPADLVVHQVWGKPLEDSTPIGYELGKHSSCPLLIELIIRKVTNRTKHGHCLANKMDEFL